MYWNKEREVTSSQLHRTLCPLVRSANRQLRATTSASCEDQEALTRYTKRYRSRRKVLVARNLGGAGKLQLVLNYIQEHRHDYSAVFCIEAGQKETLKLSLVSICLR
jgi:hypothetical protein